MPEVVSARQVLMAKCREAIAQVPGELVTENIVKPEAHPHVVIEVRRDGLYVKRTKPLPITPKE